MNKENRIKIYFEYLDEDTNLKIKEGVWAKKLSNGYEIDNIPFYVKSTALGDIFTVKESDKELYADELIKESGNSTIQVLIDNVEKVPKIREDLKKRFDCESELSNLQNLISINIPLNIDYSLVRNYLDAGETNEFWEYQEACISSKHQED